MPVSAQQVTFSRSSLERIQAEIQAQDLDGWLLSNFHGYNPVASSLLGLGAQSRRYFVMIPASGPPVALTHRIEQQPWDGWIGEKRIYLSWKELESELGAMLADASVIAMETSPGGAVPYIDLVPAGTVEMVRATGVEVRSSAELVSTFYSRWSAAGVASHRRAAEAVQATAHAAFGRIADAIRAGREVDEWEVSEWIRGELERRGLWLGTGTIVAVNANAANPHYAPSEHAHAPIRTGDLVLIDLWGKEGGDDAVYADQTWMAYVGDSLPDRIAGIWEVLRGAREAAVQLIRERDRDSVSIAGWEVDRAARAYIEARGHGPHFAHRTGHSIDTELHGSGPNIDDLETRDTRRLIPGIGFSIEPGIYIPGDLGFRTEINVFMGENGPEVTTPDPQNEILLLLR
jgi:Xaa-Pro dipeptidase